ncbi:CoB--CoM heterodisulfide reductase subunit C [uncultured Methanobrevibacter sp.]|uniref:CoB--CoM heterodisulfide reductase subunit C n=1 Tax=uncultured Methanobrevibacter sp. TaxID=253161 RepID=UPI0025DBE390|nr:CoB--CoM heterodisulfide reductase subunit C [uncultured Methanobrevibacter sp.]
MSIINRLKFLFKGENDKEVTDITNDVSNTSDDVQATSSKKVNDSIVSGTKTTAPISSSVKNDSEEDSNDLTFKKDLESLDDEKDSSEEIVKEDTPSETTTKEEVPKEDKLSEDDKEVKQKLNNKERDKMTLLTDKEILNDSNRDPDFTAEFIDAGIETVKHCFQCGTCSGGCPSGRRTPYKVRQIVRKCLLGLKEEVISDDALWMCTTCYTCQERCLRSVKIVEIIKKARNIAAHAGYMAKPHKMTGVFVMNTGHAVPINDDVKALRSKIGLPEVPPTTHANPDALAEVQKLCKITAFDELIGYDEATGGLKE